LISAGHLISERVMLKNDHFFAVSARDGSMKPGEFAGDGLWSGDTRILSTLRVLVDGVEPTAVGLHADDGSATFELEAAGLTTLARWVAGVLLAAAAVQDALAPSRHGTRVTRFNVLRPIAVHTSQLTAKDPRAICICQDEDYRQTYRQKYPAR